MNSSHFLDFAQESLQKSQNEIEFSNVKIIKFLKYLQFKKQLAELVDFQSRTKLVKNCLNESIFYIKDAVWKMINC